MKKFQGFPARMEFTPLPNLFVNRLMPEITDMAELKATLYVMTALYRKKGYPRYVTEGELLADTAAAAMGEASLKHGLELAVERGTLLGFSLEKVGEGQGAFLLNDKTGRETLEKIKSGEIEIAGMKAAAPPPAEAGEVPDIFTAYEQNIGMLTPMIAEELGDAEKRYPEQWIQDAIREAALHNKRSIRYIVRILERWQAEGRSDGSHRGHSEKADPDKYFKGKYGHMVQR